MKNWILTLPQKCLVTIILWFVASQGAFALSSQELSRLSISNETGLSLRFIFASPSDSGIWGPDLLRRRPLEYGQTGNYYVHYSGNRVRFDFLALDSRNDAYLIQGWLMVAGQDSILQLTKKYHLGPFRSLPIAHVFLTNATNRSFNYLFFSPEISRSWGFDILNDTTSLGPGETISFAVPVGKTENKFEILALSKEQAVVHRRLSLQESNLEVFIDFTLNDLQ